MNKCAYCHEEVSDPHSVVTGKEKDCLICCSETCAEKALSFYNYFDRTKVFFVIGLAISMVLLFVSIILLSIRQMWNGSIFLGVSFSLLGLIILLFPFATPQTFSSLGIRKAIWVTRLFGIGVMALGLFLAYFVRT